MRAGECTIKGLLQFELYRARETLKNLAAKAVNGVTSEGVSKLNYLIQLFSHCVDSQLCFETQYFSLLTRSRKT